jgi:hypothetical protein
MRQERDVSCKFFDLYIKKKTKKGWGEKTQVFVSPHVYLACGSVLGVRRKLRIELAMVSNIRLIRSVNLASEPEFAVVGADGRHTTTGAVAHA